MARGLTLAETRCIYDVGVMGAGGRAALRGANFASPSLALMAVPPDA